MSDLILFLGIPIVLGLFVFFYLAYAKNEAKAECKIKTMTLNGQKPKSIAEKRIADYLLKNNINYVYQGEKRIKGLFFNSKINRSYFYLPDYKVYVEYWGLFNSDDYRAREDYVKNMNQKMSNYHKNKIKFIAIYPHNMNDLDWIFKEKFQKVTGIKLVNSLR